MGISISYIVYLINLECLALSRKRLRNANMILLGVRILKTLICSKKKKKKIVVRFIHHAEASPS